MAGSTHGLVMPPEGGPGAGGFWRQAWRRLRRKRLALCAGGVIALIALAAFAGPHLSGIRYDSLDWDAIAIPPQFGGAHWLGTDRLGRDLFVRTVYGCLLYTSRCV